MILATRPMMRTFTALAGGRVLVGGIAMVLSYLMVCITGWRGISFPSRLISIGSLRILENMTEEGLNVFGCRGLEVLECGTLRGVRSRATRL